MEFPQNITHLIKGSVMLKIRNIILLFALSGLIFIAGACEKKGPTGTLMMATTSSTDNTGLLDYLKPEFEKATGIELKWASMGTGKALAFGKNCDCDILMVHAPGAEKKYIADGFGIERKEIMYNDFILIGPEADPANIKGKSVTDALSSIQSGNALFASRGDNSGTNKKEIKLWKTANLTVPEKQSWYLQTGQGMINTITVAEERNAYTMTDRGTYIKYESQKKGNPALKILVEGDANLLNQYSVISINPEKCDNTKIELSREFTKWIASEQAQKLIANFRLLNKQLFTPNAK